MIIVEEPIVEYKSGYLEIVDAKYISGYKIRILINNRKENVVDFEKFLTESNHPFITKYLNQKSFTSFRITDGNLNWDNYGMIFPLSDLYNGSISYE